MITARQLALDVLHQARQKKIFASEAIDSAFTAGISPQERRFVTQLVMNAIRRRATIDALLTPFVSRPQHAVEPRLWDILQLGCLQMVFLTQIPPHAAVHETVELAKYIGKAKATGFVNGVLRRIAELVTTEFVDNPAADTVPLEQGRYRRLSKPVLPDIYDNDVAYLYTAFSLPQWLAESWCKRFNYEECLRLGFWFLSTPPLWLRTNKLKTQREAYRLQLEAARVDCETADHPQAIKILEGAAIRDLPGYNEGEFSVQDLSSMQVATAVQPQPGMQILDLCSAPGGKTTHMAELMDNRGKIIACDIEQKRLDSVNALCQRLGVSIVETRLLKETDAAPAGPFHAALVDVPCSNTGVLGRRPEVRWRLKPNEFEHLIRLQTRLLFAAIEQVKPGGAIVYSTCSIEPDENEGVVKAVLRGMKGLKVEADSLAIPGRPADGGFWCRIRKPL